MTAYCQSERCPSTIHANTESLTLTLIIECIGLERSRVPARYLAISQARVSTCAILSSSATSQRSGLTLLRTFFRGCSVQVSVCRRGWRADTGPTLETQRLIDRRRGGCSTTCAEQKSSDTSRSVSYTHLRAHETRHDLVCRLLLEKKKEQS